MDLLRHLSFFVAVAEEGHFGNAAARLGMTQPPLSQGLRRLESRLGAELISRGTRSVGLTDVGRQLLPRARLLVSDAVRFEDEARRITGGRDALVRWGATGSIDDAGVLSAIRALRNLDGARQSRVITATAGTVDLTERVRSGDLDVAVVEHPALLTGLDCGPVLKRRRWVLVAADHPIATAEQPQVRMLRGLALCTGLRSDNPPAHDALVDLWKARGLDPDVTVVTSARDLFSRVAAGGCFGVSTNPPTAMPGVRWVDLLRSDLALRLRIISRPGADVRWLMDILDRTLRTR